MGIFGGLILKPTAVDDSIMSFQTDKNGTFNPVITPSSGTLRWVVDGVEQITNTPSYALIGNTVDVKVFANDVVQDERVTNTTFANQGIIGDLSFEYFEIFVNSFNMNGNTNLQDIKLNSSFPDQKILSINVDDNNIQILDVSDAVFTFTFLYRNTQTENIIFRSSGNASTQIRVENSKIETLDLSSFAMSGIWRIRNNSLLTTIVPPASGGSITAFNLDGNPLLTTADLSPFNIDGTWNNQNNTLLTSVILPAITTNCGVINFSSCALNLATVDGLLSFLNTFFTSNTPIKNMTLTLSGGTNSSPTDGSSNTDLVNLRDVVFPNAGFTFTANIN